MIAAANEAFRELMTAGAPGLEGRRADSVFRAAAATQVRQALKQCLVGGEPVRLRVAHAVGSDLLRVDVRIRRISTGAGVAIVLAVAPLDGASSLAELGEAGVLAELGALSRGLVYIKDLERGRVRHGPHPLVGTLGLAGEAQSTATLVSKIHPDDLKTFRRYEARQRAASDDDLVEETVRVRGAAGEWVWLNLRCRVFTRDQQGAVNRLIIVATDVSDTYAHAEAMAAAADALAQAEVNERRRIGRELHDSTSQYLVAARLGLGAVERGAWLTDPASAALGEAHSAIARAQVEIRNFSFVLHPPALESGGLPLSLRSFIDGFSRRTGLRLHVKVGRNVGRLPHRVEIALYRVLQEALMNVYRHAQARSAQVRLKLVSGRAVLEVQDDGTGLARGSAEGVGISGMRARMLQLGGSLRVESAARGVLVRASAPVRAEPAIVVPEARPGTARPDCAPMC